MTHKIALVALNMNKNADTFEDFDKLPAEEKVLLIKQRIKDICADLQKAEPDSMWLVSWREFGITDKGESKALPRSVKKMLQKEMQELTRQYPQLTIIAGTLSTLSHSTDPDKLNRIKNYYDNHPWVKTRESSKLKDKHILNEQAKVGKALESEAISREGFDAIRNTCFVFNGNDIWNHDKITPVYEKNYANRNALFQPGSKKNPQNSSYLTLFHPSTGEPIRVGVEICREHLFGVLHKSEEDKALIHLILSDSIGMKLNHLQGEYALQLDSKFKPQLILTQTSDNNFQFHFYQDDIEEPHQLKGPLKPVYPFVLQVNDKFNAAIEQFPDKKEILFEIQCRFLSAVKEHDYLYDPIDVVYNALEEGLKDERLHMSPHSTLFTPLPIMSIINEFRELIAFDRINNVEGMDYRTSQDAPPLKI